MSRVRSKNTKPEKLVRGVLHGLGFRFRLHSKILPGCPDLILPKFKTVVFVHGCFWHGHQNCKKALLPQQNRAFWSEKIGKNQKRDKAAVRQLQATGWNVITIWGCELSGDIDKLGKRLTRLIKGRLPGR